MLTGEHFGSILCCSFPRGIAQDNERGRGLIEGQVSLAGVSQHQFVAGVSVVAKGPVLLNTETDANGNYHFVEVPPGEYAVSATFSGSEATQRLEVEPNRTVQLNLQIKLVTATTVMFKQTSGFSAWLLRRGRLPRKRFELRQHFPLSVNLDRM